MGAVQDVPNKDRGEVGFTLGKTNIVLEPSFKRLAELRSATGKRFTAYFKEISEAMGKQDAPTEELATCLFHLSRHPEFKDVAEAGDLVARHGAVDAFSGMADLVSVVLSGKSIETLDNEKPKAGEKDKAEGEAQSPN